ncbi:hypothetical protein [Caballeronia sp. Lep1P3]|uniref:hypothetical protein n=1 Tax=Caballeronia sp. Lep1P3 TaxID=2878150 RepID=UPI001FD46565|nr:hypothetical protein [Caballeronia sp. Lep1P3]
MLDVLTHDKVGSEAKPPEQQASGATTTTLESNRSRTTVRSSVVVATTYEIAREAAQRTRIEYDEEPSSATFGSVGVEGERREPGEHERYRVGDLEVGA